MFLFYIFYKLWFIVIVVGDLRKVNFKLMLSLNNHPIRKAKKIKIPAIFNWINMHAFVCYLVPHFDYLCARSRDCSLFTCLNWHKLLYMGLYYAELAWSIKGISKTVISQPCHAIYHLYGTVYNSIIYIILIKCGCLYWVKKMLRLDNASVYHCSSTNVEGSLYGTKKLPCYSKVKLDC